MAFGAIALFGAIGGQIIPEAVSQDLTKVDSTVGLLAPFLLTCALIILAWRRAVEQKELYEQLEASRRREERLAYLDDITGLRNRRCLMKEVFSSTSDDKITLLLLDLDGFKKVNDLMGHEAGDTLLHAFAERMTDLLPDGADAFRLGGDEFAVTLRGLAADEGLATHLASTIVNAVGQPFQIAGTQARVGVSIGLSTREGSEELPTVVLHRSDIAMYEAKRLGKGRAVWFDAEMERVREERNRDEADIRRGLTRGEFAPHFQPLLELTSLQIRGFEVFARWEHPRRGTLGPEAFIEIAESTGLISELTLVILRSALSQSRHWPEHLALAINVSSVQFKDPLLADRLLTVVGEFDFDPARLEIDVSEHAMLSDNQQTLITLHRLRAAGVRIALDDFGTSFAALGQFRDMPFDRIKIDRHFVSSLRKNRNSDAVVSAITAMGKTLSLPISAEGIEEETIQDLLVSMGATDGQGWLYGAALSGSEAARKYLDLEESGIRNPDLGEVSSLHSPDRRQNGRN